MPCVLKTQSKLCFMDNCQSNEIGIFKNTQALQVNSIDLSKGEITSLIQIKNRRQWTFRIFCNTPFSWLYQLLVVWLRKPTLITCHSISWFCFNYILFLWMKLCMETMFMIFYFLPNYLSYWSKFSVKILELLGIAY